MIMGALAYMYLCLHFTTARLEVYAWGVFSGSGAFRALSYASSSKRREEHKKFILGRFIWANTAVSLVGTERLLSSLKICCGSSW